MNLSGRHPGTLSEDSAMGGKTNAIIVTLQDQREAIVSRTDNANTHHCGYALSPPGNRKTHIIWEKTMAVAPDICDGWKGEGARYWWAVLTKHLALSTEQSNKCTQPPLLTRVMTHGRTVQKPNLISCGPDLIATFLFCVYSLLDLRKVWKVDI